MKEEFVHSFMMSISIAPFQGDYSREYGNR